MESNLAQFNKELDNFTKKVPAMATVIQKKVVLEALRRLVMRTPVDTGRARANWQVTISEPSEGQVDSTDVEGNAAIAKGLAALTGLPDFQVIWISNNVDYIEFLEHGSSKQAPEGMLAVTVEELRNWLARAD
jgi:hypothetical protein